MNLRHGMRYTVEYRAWLHMKDRCNNKKHNRYVDYGGRGIKVCQRWMDSFVNFIEDVGKRPNGDYSLNRIDNNLGYQPGNCEWATKSIQMHNRRGFGKTGVLGIHKAWNGYQALITKNYKRYYLGVFKTLEEAKNAYLMKERELYG